MKHTLLSLILVAAAYSPAAAQINFDTASNADFNSLISASGQNAAEASAPERVQEGGACEPFSVEAAMRDIPVYDQQLAGTPESDTGICYAVVAAHMFDHLAVSRGRGAQLASPLMLDLPSRIRDGQGGQGGELTSEVLQSMAQQDVCTLGVTAGSRASLGVAEELDMVSPARGGEGKEASPQGRFDALPKDGERARAACRPLPVPRFNALYMRTRQVGGPNGTHGLPITIGEFRGFLARNTALQPVAVKFNYEAILGDPARAEGASQHWALIIARQQRGNTCQYLIRNSMGRDNPLVWTDEERLVSVVRSMAVLVP